MNLGQTMLSVAALALLSLITLSYYGSIGQSGQNLNLAKAGITATTIATSFIERAQNLPFDAKTSHLDSLSADSVINNPGVLTAPTLLGREGETCLDDFNDFDDFNNWTETIQTNDKSETYKAKFLVYYVQPNNIEVNANTRTFVKRMDITVCRTNPPMDTASSSSFDTVSVSTVLGYFKFR